jgi:hypothetical protein
MKKFDLQKALAGEPVVTRTGLKIQQLNYFDFEGILEPIVCKIEGIESIYHFYKDGKYFNNLMHDKDLFMAGPEKWVNIYYNEHLNHVTTGAIYETEEEAQKHSINVPNFQCTIKLKS